MMRMVCKQLSLMSSELSCYVCVPGATLAGAPSRSDALTFIILFYSLSWCSAAP